MQRSRCVRWCGKPGAITRAIRAMTGNYYNLISDSRNLIIEYGVPGILSEFFIIQVIVPICCMIFSS